MFDKAYAIRKCKKRLEELKHTPPKPETEKDRDNKKHILKLAEQAHAERRHNVDIDVNSRMYETAGDLMNVGKGRVLFSGFGWGPGKKLEPGRYIWNNGKWVKKE